MSKKKTCGIIVAATGLIATILHLFGVPVPQPIVTGVGAVCEALVTEETPAAGY